MKKRKVEKMRRNKVLSKVTALLLMAIMVTALFNGVGAKAAGNLLIPAKPTGKFDFEIEPGQAKHIVIPIKTISTDLDLFSVYGESTNTNLRILNVKFMNTDESSSTGTEVTQILANHHYNLEFDVMASESLKIGYNTVSFSGFGVVRDYSTGGDAIELQNDTLLTLTSYTATELKPLEIVIDSIVYDETAVVPGNNFTIKLKLKNIGERPALNTYLSMDFNNSGIIPNYNVENFKVDSIYAGKTVSVDIPVTVLKTADPNYYTISANIECKDSDGLEKSFIKNIYITIKNGKDEGKKGAPNISLSTSDNYKILLPDTEDNIKVVVKNTGESDAKDVRISVNSGLDASAGLTRGYTSDSISAGDIKAGESKTVTIPIRVSKGFAPGLYELQISAAYKDSANNEKTSNNMTMYVKGTEKKESTVKSSVVLKTENNYTVLKPDTETNLIIIVKNNGKTDITNVKVNVISGLETSIGLTKGYTTDGIKVGKLKAGEEKKVKVPVRTSKSFAPGLYEIQMNASYTDSQSAEKTSSVMTMYIKGPDEKMPDEKHGSVSIGNVSQSPENPKAGEEVTVSFDIINDGNASISNVKVSATGLSSSTFEPVSSEPYKKVSSIGAGSRARVSLTLKVGKDIPEGFNTLNVSCEYSDASGVTSTESAGLYILNVENELRGGGGNQKNSRPKLIINRYSAEPVIDPEELEMSEDPDKLMHELKAGKVFTFSYTLINTHATKAAKNIKITLEQVEGIFAPTEGSNIFYIDQIPAGESSEQTVMLKTRSDVATGDYAISVKVEYEYDDMSEADAERGGVVDENTIKLHATENYRPEIENIFIDASEGVMVGMPVDLSFEFFNMGKSTLGNVYVTIEGDFMLANNASKTYVGAVGGYCQEYVNPQIIALVPGEAVGYVVVHFEDSNGDEQTKEAQFTAYVMGGDGDMDYIDYGNYGNMSGGYYGFDDFEGGFDGMEDGEFEDVENEEETKIIGLPVWLFVTICVTLGVVIIVIVVVVIVKKHKKALLDEDDE